MRDTRVNAGDGSVGDPFDSLYDAYVASQAGGFTAGTYYFDIDGNPFSSYVDANGYVAVASADNATPNVATGYPQVTALTLNSDTILSSTIVGAVNPDELRMTSTGAVAMDRSTTEQRYLDRFTAYTALGSDNTDDNAAWPGSGGSLNGNQSTGLGTPLNELIWHGSGNTALLHWFPNGDVAQEDGFGSEANTSQPTLWMRDSTPSTSPGGVVDGDLSLWLKADDAEGLGLTGANVDTWTDTDRSLTFDDLPTADTATLTPAQAQFVEGSTDFNFNPTLYFTPDNARLRLISDSVLDDDDDTLSFYAVTHGVGGAAFQSVFNYRSGSDAQGQSGLELNGKVFGGSQGYTITTNPVAPVNNGTYISSFSANGADRDYYYNGEEYATTVAPSSSGRSGQTNPDQFFLGTFAGGGSPLQGSLAELIVFGTNSSPLERQKIESYLALKYGASLDQAIATDYFASDCTDATCSTGTVMWDASAAGAGYNKDIFGLGRDDASVLDQRVSKSVSTGTILTIALDNDFTSANTDTVNRTTQLGDLEFVTFANNGGATTAQGTEIAGNDSSGDAYNTRPTREWQIQNPDAITGLNVKFDGFAGYDVLMSTDSDFSDFDITNAGDTRLGTLDTNGELAALTFTDGAYFTLAKYEEKPFITTWTVDASDLEIFIPTRISSVYNYDIDWGDGTIETGITTQDYAHTYATAGTYTVTITGDFPHFFSDSANSGSAQVDIDNMAHLASLEQWGDQQWDTLSAAFTQAVNMTYNATDAPDLSGVTSLDATFSKVGDMNNVDFSNWNVSTITDMRATFSNAGGSFSGLDNWDVSNVTRLQQTFIAADLSNTDITGWDVGMVNNFVQMFRNNTTFNQDISNWNMSSATTVSGMFLNAPSFNQDLSNWERVSGVNGATTTSTMANVANYSAAFQQATAFNGAVNTWNTSGATNMTSAFLSATSFSQPLDNWDTSSVTSMEKMFSNASSFDQDLSSFDMSGLQVTATPSGGAISMLDNSGLSVANYDAALIAWDAQTLDPSGELGAAGLEYCSGATAHADIIAGGWSIVGDIENCGVVPGGVGSGLQLWLKADADVDNTGDGSVATGWTDQVDSANDFTPQTGNPRYTVDGINYNPSIDFDASGDYFRLAGDAFTGDFSTGGFDAFYVTEAPDAGTYDTALYFGANDNNTNAGIAFGQSTTTEGLILALNTSGAHTETEWSPTSVTSDVHIWNASNTDKNNFNTTSVVYADGALQSSSVNAAADNSWSGNTENVMIGNARNNVDANCIGCQFNGEIAEVIAYSNELGATERQQIQSYLALKYGITLDQGAATDYLASDGSTTAWTAADNTGFNNDIFGIGRDDTSALGQVHSKSVNSDAIVTIEAAGEGTNAANAFTDIADLEFLTIANDNDDDGAIEVVTSELDTNTYQDRLDREWKVDEEGDVGTVDLDIDLSGTFASDQTIYLLVDDESDFSADANTNGQAITATSWDGTTATFDGISLTDGDYFTVAGDDNVAPANPTVGTLTPNPAQTGTTVTLSLTGVEAGASVSVPGLTCTPDPADATGAVSCTGTATSGLLDGTNNTITVTDPAGNENTATSAPTLTIDDTAPGTPTVTSFGGDITPSYDTNDTIPDLVLGTVETGATVAITGWTCTPSPADATGVVTCTPDNPLAEGNNSVTPTVTDAAGNQTTMNQIDVNVDTGAPANPAVGSLSPNPAQTGTTVTLSLTGVEAGASVSVPGLTCTPDPADATGAVSCTGTATSGLLDGTNNTITVTDPAGNENTASSSPTLVIDDTAPGTPTVDVQTTKDTTPEISGTLPIPTDASDTVEIVIDGNTYAAVNNGNGTWTLPDDTISPILTDGSYDVAVTVTDTSGNEATHTETDGITIDATVPTSPVVNSPTSGENPEVFPEININVECEAVGDTITVYGPGITPDPATHTCTGVGPVDIPVTLDPGGEVSVTVTVTDTTGNESAPTTTEFTAGTADDADGDGTPDLIESVAPDGDGNGDGIPDAEQGEVASRPNPVNDAHITLEATGDCSFVNDYAVVAESDLAVQDGNFEYPVGLNDFQLQCADPGDSATVTFYYDREYDTSAWRFNKFDDTGNVYSDITDIATFDTANVNGTTVTTITYIVTDGGVTDVDGIADGVITDPAGPAIEADDLSQTGTSAWRIVLVGASIVAVALFTLRKIRTIQNLEAS